MADLREMKFTEEPSDLEDKIKALKKAHEALMGPSGDKKAPGSMHSIFEELQKEGRGK